MAGKSVSRSHDEDGLRLEQRALLQSLADGLSRTQALKHCGLSIYQWNRWMRAGTPFRAAYDRLNVSTAAETRRLLESASSKAGDVLVDAMDAMKDVTMEVTCPQCQTKFGVEAEIPNHNVRLKASEITLRAARVLKDVREVESSVTHMSIEQRIALALWKAGKVDQIPSHMWEELVKLGLIPATEAQSYKLLEARNAHDHSAE